MLKKRNRSIFIKSIHVKSSIFLTKKSVTMKTISEPDMPGDLGGASAYKVVLLRLHQATSKNVPKLIHSRILCVWEKSVTISRSSFFLLCSECPSTEVISLLVLRCRYGMHQAISRPRIRFFVSSMFLRGAIFSGKRRENRWSLMMIHCGTFLSASHL